MSNAQDSLPFATDEEIVRQVNSESRQYAYRTLEYPVEVLVAKMQREEILIPSYQRDLIWKDWQKCYFIESVLLQIPVSPMFAATISGGLINLVDGSQRIRCLQSFLKNEFRLKGLEKLSQLNGLRFKDLPREVVLNLLTRDVRIVLLTDGYNDTAQFEIFRRINSSPTLLNDSEIRRGAFPGRFWTLIEECAASPLLIEQTPMGSNRTNRFEREELVLRFFAYGDRYKIFVHDVNKFLDEYLRHQNEAAEADTQLVDQYRKRFETTMTFVKMNLPGSLQRRGRQQTPRTRFEAIAVGAWLALESGETINTHDVSWLSTEAFESATRAEAANSGPRVKGRIEYVRNKLLDD